MEETWHRNRIQLSPFCIQLQTSGEYGLKRYFHWHFLSNINRCVTVYICLCIDACMGLPNCCTSEVLAPSSGSCTNRHNCFCIITSPSFPSQPSLIFFKLTWARWVMTSMRTVCGEVITLCACVLLLWRPEGCLKQLALSDENTRHSKFSSCRGFDEN